MHDMDEEPLFLYQFTSLSIRMIYQVLNIKNIQNWFEIECFITLDFLMRQTIENYVTEL